MDNDLHLNEKLEKQKLNTLFLERGKLDLTDEKVRNDLWNRLVAELVMNTRFISPVTIEDAGNGDQNITFRLLRSNEGDRYFPVFTSSEDLALWKETESGETAQFIFDNYANMLAVNAECKGFVVNPFSDNFKVEKDLAAQWLEQKQVLMQGHANHAITKDTKYEVYAPSPYPFQLSDKLCEAAKTKSEVERLWLRGINLDGKDAYLAVVEYDGDRDAVFGALGENAREFLKEMPLYIVPFEPGFAEQAVDKVLPIYVKEK